MVGVTRGTKDVKLTRDGNWQVELVAFKIDWVAYKAIGSTATVRHRELVKNWFTGTNMKWVERPVAGITVQNVYQGLLAKISPGATSRSCSAKNRSSCDCREWSVGISISVDASKDTGLPTAPGPTSFSPGATLEIRSVRSRASVQIGNELVQLGEVEAK